MWKGLFGGRWPSRQEERIYRAYPQHNQNNQRQVDFPEEDGFVLVGETAIERSRVGPNHAVSSHLDTPPSYESYVDALPSYESQVNRSSYHPLSSYTPFFSALNMGQRSSNQITTEVSPDFVVNASSDPISRFNDPPSYLNEMSHQLTHQPGMHVGGSINQQRAQTASSFVSTLPGEVIDEEVFTATPQLPPAGITDCPLGGVPFKLATWLEYLDTDWSAYDCLTVPNINIADFQYDFSLERNSVG